MKTIIFTTVLLFFWNGVNGQENVQDEIDAVFNTDKNRAKSPTVTKPEGTQCECVPYYLCKNSNINTDGFGIIDIAGEGGDCESYLDVCCNPHDRTTAPIPPTPTPSSGCGYRNPEGVFRITGDEDGEAQYGEFPWVVAILTEEFNADTNSVLNVYKCGGSLIHPQAVLTAAHCVSDSEKKYKIRAGEWDAQTTEELYPHQDRFVKSINIHNKYESRALLNDIAILFLEESVTISETVNTLCLPEQDIVIPSGTRCFASGWGKDVYGKEGKYEVILQKVDLPIVERNTCQKQLRSTRLGNNFVLDKSFLCSGGEKGKDACKGDSGSALACPIPGQNNRYQHIGIMAWGVGCGGKVPSAYVNVPIFRRWIDEQITNHKLDPASYHP